MWQCRCVCICYFCFLFCFFPRAVFLWHYIGHHWYRQWPVICTDLNHYLRHSWLGWNLNKDISVFIKYKYRLQNENHLVSTAMCYVNFSAPSHRSLIQFCRIYASMNRISTGSDNGLSPIRRHAFIWTNAGLLLITPLGTNFSEISIKIQNFSFTKLHLKMSFAKWRPFCPGGDELIISRITYVNRHILFTHAWGYINKSWIWQPNNSLDKIESKMYNQGWYHRQNTNCQCLY